MYSDLWSLTVDEDTQSCTRCNNGTGNHTCWRLQIQQATDFRITEPLRAHQKHPSAKLTPSRVLSVGYTPR